MIKVTVHGDVGRWDILGPIWSRYRDAYRDHLAEVGKVRPPTVSVLKPLHPRPPTPMKPLRYGPRCGNPVEIRSPRGANRDRAWQVRRRLQPSQDFGST